MQIQHSTAAFSTQHWWTMCRKKVVSERKWTSKFNFICIFLPFCLVVTHKWCTFVNRIATNATLPNAFISKTVRIYVKRTDSTRNAKLNNQTQPFSKNNRQPCDRCTAFFMPILNAQKATNMVVLSVFCTQTTLYSSFFLKFAVSGKVPEYTG